MANWKNPDMPQGNYDWNSIFGGFVQVFAGSGNLLVDGNIGVGTSTAPAARIDVKGEIKLGSTGLACTTASSGALRYNATSNAIEFCNGASWSGLSAGGSNSSTNAPVDTTPPIITPSVLTGHYATAQTVSLTINEPGTIYYTTNGSTPTISSLIYSAPIVIPASATLMYFGKDTAGNASAVMSQIYDISTIISVVHSVAGTYSQTFATNATVTVGYINGAGGGAATTNDWGQDGGKTYINRNGEVLANAYGGSGAQHSRPGSNGAAVNLIGGINVTGGGGWGGSGTDYPDAGAGGAVRGGSFYRDCRTNDYHSGRQRR